MKKCGSCGFENPEEGKFCRKCGTKLEEKKLAKFCRFCGKEAAEGTLFCTGCGKSLQMTTDNTMAQPEQSVAQPKQPAAQPKQPVVQPKQPAVQPKQEAEKKNVLPIIIVVVILIAALAGGGIWLANSGLLGNGDSEKENDRVESQVSEEDKDENQDDDNTENETQESTENVIEENTEYIEDTEYIEESTEYEIEETETTEITENTDYILPTSNSEYLTMEDLQGLTAEECRIARNELYARYGRKFLDEALMEYFESKSWYTGVIEPEDFNDLEWLNEYEIANRDLIVEYETLQGYR